MPAKKGEGVRSKAGGFVKLGVFIMTTFTRIIAVVRSVAGDQAGMSSMRFAVAIGFASSAMLVAVRVAAAASLGL